jgi:hypothetical protein
MPERHRKDEPYSSPMDSEPFVVIERRKELTYLLCQAAELEHGIMCQYLYAAFSLKQRADAGLAERELARVGGWRSTLLAIAREEMLHWALVQNLLVAVGSAPFVSRPHLPHQAKGYPPGVQLRLLPFGRPALQHFVYLERPAGVDLSDGSGFTPDGDEPAPMSVGEVVPRAQDFVRVGHLYRSIEAGLANLAEKIGEDKLFIGPAFHQADERSFGWPDLRPIVDLAGARAAVERIVVQGEGASGDSRSAHYGRFVQVLREYDTIKAADPGFEPAHPVVAAGMRAVDGIEPDFYISDALTGMTSDLFNAVYELLLQVISRYFAFGHETPEERVALAQIAVDLMIKVLEPLGNRLARMDVASDVPGMAAGANFQLPYRANFLLPHRRSAWIRFAERLRELGTFASEIPQFDAENTTAHIGAVLAAMAGTLEAHVESASSPRGAGA